ncbi:hypothetical protein COT82_02595 [Candidatus Campbellbacteria bacterium CG10_big_fil_rev_8_21_14_0_10_35_52]|uniref:EfeO-type cupredoxin-like domain-containing protein n=1 Tax=Candidatus Campbellbacteria bacterium CG10_big_fil_rev_8_21_14_0_10_35_52 TaxID=1974527 RepID=A0A2M6WUV0_9BACT|nr:MAG: hypothetical protein COT82_02595 [Candidatus Campbellbacteria bacterium CG10_big_fil_rev_8_21_14_0_10_35_52]
MKGIIAIIVIIIVIIFGFLIIRDGTDNTQTSIDNGQSIQITENDSIADIEISDITANIDTTAEIIFVTYSDEGFTPKEITVANGQTVRFVNESSGNMWVASDTHPAHTILPEFDSKKAVGNGENYEFTFTKIGKWNYHNHIKPNLIGTIIVE